MDMERTSESSGKFRTEVLDFLVAARSVRDVLINEIAAGDVATKNRISHPISLAMKADPEMETLVNSRNVSLKEGDLDLEVKWVDESYPGLDADPGLGDFHRRYRLRQVEARSRDPYRVARTRVIGVPAQPKPQIPRAFFIGIADRDAYTVCAQHLEKLKKAADQCVQKYL